MEHVLDPARTGVRTERDGYLDLLGDDDALGAGPSQRLMGSRVLPVIYERIWRPLGSTVLALGASSPLEVLEVHPGDTVLDVACGPGNFTRAFARAVAPGGIAVGVDASRTMLAEAVREGGDAPYARADAAALPFRDAAIDAVCCFAALYLIERPFEAIAELARVLAPGGHVALLASVARGPLPAVLADAVVRPATGIRVFGRDDLTGALRQHGLVDVRRRVSGVAQIVSARRP